MPSERREDAVDTLAGSSAIIDAAAAGVAEGRLRRRSRLATATRKDPRRATPFLHSRRTVLARHGREFVCGRCLLLCQSRLRAYGKGQVDQAIADYDQALRLDANFADAYCNRGVAWNAKGDHDKALADLDQSLRLDPHSAVAYYNRGDVWIDKGQYNRALDDFDQALRLDPKYAPAYYNRGELWRSKGQDDRALEDLNQALRLDPRCAECYKSRGEVWYSKGQYDRAIEDFSQAVHSIPIAPSAITAAATPGKPREISPKPWKVTAGPCKPIPVTPSAITTSPGSRQLPRFPLPQRQDRLSQRQQGLPSQWRQKLELSRRAGRRLCRQRRLREGRSVAVPGDGDQQG